MNEQSTKHGYLPQTMIEKTESCFSLGFSSRGKNCAVICLRNRPGQSWAKTDPWLCPGWVSSYSLWSLVMSEFYCWQKSPSLRLTPILLLSNLAVNYNEFGLFLCSISHRHLNKKWKLNNCLLLLASETTKIVGGREFLEAKILI